MNKVSRNNIKKSIPVVSTIVILFLSALSVMNSPSNVNALDLSSLDVADNLGQSLHCVIVVVGCDGTGSVGSSGDTIIGSNNGNNDTNTTDEGSVPEIDSQDPE